MSTEQLILGIIRGDLPLSMMDKAGVHITVRGNAYDVTSEFPISVVPSAIDIARGLFNYKDKKDLKEWGIFMMHAPVVDLAALEIHPQGDLILGALWDAAFDGRLTDQVIAEISKIVKV
jgi:hypothetical protein